MVPSTPFAFSFSASALALADGVYDADDASIGLQTDDFRFSSFGISLSDTEGYTVEKALKEAGLTVSLTSVIAVGIDDRPGEFAKAMRILADADISVEYMYAFISRDKGKAFVILRVDDSEKAMEHLRAKGVTLLAAEEIYGM